MPYVKSSGANIWYDVVGDGEPLVLIGGSSLVHRQWDFMLPILRDHFKVILYDQRGAGLSDRPASGITVEQWVDDLRAVLEEIGIKKTHLYGTSNGSFIVVRFAAKHPERTGAIIHYGMYKTEDQAAKMTRIGSKIIDEFGTGRMGSYFLVRLYGIPPEYEDWVVKRFEENNSPDSWKAMHEALKIDLTEDLRKIKSSQLLLLGDRGPMSKDSDYGSGWKEVQRLRPDIEMIIIPNSSGTVCVLEVPAKVAKTAIGFLQKHPIRT
jgi:pimeloyl-ACP methyl ester carboxylesterase